jgi:hypothetical protein
LWAAALATISAGRLLKVPVGENAVVDVPLVQLQHHLAFICVQGLRRLFSVLRRSAQPEVRAMEHEAHQMHGFGSEHN